MPDYKNKNNCLILIQILIEFVLFTSSFYYLLADFYNNTKSFFSLDFFTFIIKGHYKLYLIVIFLWTLISGWSHYYNSNTKSGSYFKRILIQFSLFSIVFYAILGLKEQGFISNKKILIYLLFLFVSFLLNGMFFKIIKSYLYLKSHVFNEIAIFGNNDVKKSFVNDLKNNMRNKIIVDEKQFNEERICNINFESNYQTKIIYLFIDRIFDEDFVRKINLFCENNLIKLYIVPASNSYFSLDIESVYENNFRTLKYKELPFESFRTNIIKRTFDFLFSLFISVIVLSWLVPLMAITIKLTSKGPVFFLQERVGFRGKPFKIIKFRTMKIDAEKYGPQLSKDKDPRITSIGKLLRKYRVDELPQFINVLKGDMSIVGPRPEREFYIDQIIEINPRYKRLHNLKPGITSMGQVYFGYAENVKEMSERLNYDLLYLNKYSFLMDIKIIILTVVVMIKGKGK